MLIATSLLVLPFYGYSAVGQIAIGIELGYMPNSNTWQRSGTRLVYDYQITVQNSDWKNVVSEGEARIMFIEEISEVAGKDLKVNQTEAVMASMILLADGW